MGFINIHETTFIAVHSMMLIAQHSGNSLNAKELAAELNVSEAHLSKVLQSLVREGLLTSSRGPRGGFSLNRPKESITILDIYDVFEKPLHTNRECSWNKESCRFGKCPFGKILSYYNSEFKKELAAQTLADFSDTK